MIDERDITFLIHGGGLASNTTGSEHERPTKALIKSIKKYFPRAQIVLSTWDNEPVESYKVLVDYIILSKDPGTTVASKKHGITSAINRHIISTKKGLLVCNTSYTVVLRADLVFSSNKLKRLLDSNAKKIIALAGGTINEQTFVRKPFTFHVCDFIYAGKTELIEDLFDVANEFDAYLTEMYFDKIDKPFFNRPSWNDHFNQRWIPEAFVAHQHAKKQGFKIPSHSYDFSHAYKKISQEYLTSNFELFDRAQVGLKWLKNKNKWQPGLQGILGRYSRWLFLSRKSSNILLKQIFYFLHGCKIALRLISWSVEFWGSVLVSRFQKYARK